MAYYINIDEWKPEQVVEWMRGLSNSIACYGKNFMDHQISGSHLMNFGPDDLQKIGIRKLGHMLEMMAAINNLKESHFNMDFETLQSLALRVSSKSRSLSAEIRMEVAEERLPVGRGKVTTATLSGVTDLLSTVKDLLFWLDRPPFEGQDPYKSLRNLLVNISIEMATSAQRDQFAENPVGVISSNCNQITTLCEKVVVEFTDPYIAQPATLDVATVKARQEEEMKLKGDVSDCWFLGMHITTDHRGIHLVDGIRFQSAAHQTGKIEVGDEIVQINYQTVRSWDHKNIQTSLMENPSKVVLTVKKRPKHSNTFGQIYIKPYRLPSKKRDSSFRWSENVSSPRHLVIPTVEIASSPGQNTEICQSEIPSEASGGESECEDDTFIAPSSESIEESTPSLPTSASHLYLPKPRVGITRRATVTGVATSLTPVGIAPDQDRWNQHSNTNNLLCQTRPRSLATYPSDRTPLLTRTESLSAISELCEFKTCESAMENNNNVSDLFSRVGDNVKTKEEESTLKVGTRVTISSAKSVDIIESVRIALRECEAVVDQQPVKPARHSLEIESNAGQLPPSEKPGTEPCPKPSNQSVLPRVVSHPGVVHPTASSPSLAFLDDITPPPRPPVSRSSSRVLRGDAKPRIPETDVVNGYSEIKRIPPRSFEGDRAPPSRQLSNKPVAEIDPVTIAPSVPVARTPSRTFWDGMSPPPRPLSSKATQVSSVTELEVDGVNVASLTRTPSRTFADEVPPPPGTPISQSTSALSRENSGSEGGKTLKPTTPLTRNFGDEVTPPPRPPISRSGSKNLVIDLSAGITDLVLNEPPALPPRTPHNKAPPTPLELKPKSSNLEFPAVIPLPPFLTQRMEPPPRTVSPLLGLRLQPPRTEETHVAIDRPKPKTTELGRSVPCRSLQEIDCQGWLYRRRVSRSFLGGTRWTKRWYVLRKNTVYGYKEQEDQKAESLICLNGFTVTPVIEKSKKHVFKIHHASSSFFFACETQEESDRWLLRLQSACVQTGSGNSPVPRRDCYYSETDDDSVGDGEREAKSPSPRKKLLGITLSPSIARRNRTPPGLPSSASTAGISFFSSKTQHDKIAAASLDRKYLKFLSHEDKQPVPTPQYRSYRKLSADLKRQPSNLGMKPDLQPSRLTKSESPPFRPPSIAERRLGSEPRGRAFTEPLRLHLQKSPDTSPQRSNVSSRRSSLDQSRRPSFESRRSPTTPTDTYVGVSPNKIWIDSLRKGKKPPVPPKSQSPDSVKLKSAANYQSVKLPLTPDHPMQLAFEMTLDHKKNEKSRFLSFTSPKLGRKVAPSPDGSSKFQRGFFANISERKKKKSGDNYENLTMYNSGKEDLQTRSLTRHDSFFSRNKPEPSPCSKGSDSPRRPPILPPSQDPDEAGPLSPRSCKPTMGISMIGKQRRTPGVNGVDVFVYSPPATPMSPTTPNVEFEVGRTPDSTTPTVVHHRTQHQSRRESAEGTPADSSHRISLEYPPVFEPGTYSLQRKLPPRPAPRTKFFSTDLESRSSDV